MAGKYNLSEEGYQNKFMKRNISDVNSAYWEAFKSYKWTDPRKSSGSVNAYSCSIKGIMEKMNKDLIYITTEDILDFVKDVKSEKTRGNKIAHIKSILTFMISENIENCRERANKDTYLLVVCMDNLKSCNEL